MSRTLTVLLVIALAVVLSGFAGMIVVRALQSSSPASSETSGP